MNKFKFHFITKMLVNKIDRLINKDSILTTLSKNEQNSLTRNRFQINILDTSLQKIEKDFNKKNLQLRHSINYTVQSFQLIRG